MKVSLAVGGGSGDGYATPEAGTSPDSASPSPAPESACPRRAAVLASGAGQGTHDRFGFIAEMVLVRKDRRISEKHRSGGLLRIAASLRALADQAEREHRAHEHNPLIGLKCTLRLIKFHRTAGRLLLETLTYGGPQDEQLGRIVQSFHGSPTARESLFPHTCSTWRDLQDAHGHHPSSGDLLTCAEAVRRIAEGVCASDELHEKDTAEPDAAADRPRA